MNTENPNMSRPSGCLARLFWMGVGNLILVLAAIVINQNHAGFTLSVADAIFWATVVALPAVRYIDIRYLGGQTADSRPASLADWRRYSATVAGAALVLWLAAHAVP